MALPLIGAALAGLGRLAVGTAAGAGRVAVGAGRAATGTTARVGYGAALGDLAKNAVVGAGKGFVGGLKGAMISEAPGIAGAYAFGKDLRKRANASRGNASSPPSVNKSNSSTPVIGGLGSLNTSSIVVGQKQSNIINLEQVRQLKQLNDSVINQSKLISYQIGDTRQKNQFAEEAANEQAIRDDKLLEAIKNIGSGGGGKRGGGDAANDSSGGGFLSSLLGGAAGGAISKLVPLLTGAMAALPWARILSLAGTAGVYASPLLISGSTPDKETQKKQDDFYHNRAIKQAQERAAEEAKAEPRPLDRSNGNYRNNQRIWDEKYKGRKDPVTGQNLSGIYNMPVSGKISSVFGARESTTPGMSKNHQGVDFATVVGSPVYSIASGTVKSLDATGSKEGLGRFVEVDHGQGVISKYGHLSQVSVTVGSKVGPGILLGKSGGDPADPGSGISTGAHLHMEATSNGKQINPASLAGLGDLGTMGNSVQLGAAAGMPKAATPGPAAGNSPAQSSNNNQLKVISSSAIINTKPITDFTKENNAKIGAIQDSLKIKNGILKSLSGKSLEQLTVLRKQVENISLDASDKAEVLKAIDEEIKKKTVPAVIPKTSSSAYDQILAAFSTPFDKSKYGAGVQLASLDTGVRSDAGGGGGSNFRVEQEVVQTNDENTQKKLDTLIVANGISPVTGQPLATNVAYQGKQLNTTVEKFKPLFRNNSDILEDANKTFLKDLRGTFTNIFKTGLTEALLPNGVGVSASQAGRDDMYRGEQLKTITGASQKISESAVKLFGPKFGPMFGPLIDRMSTSYLEVGSRMAGKAIFQKIGGLDANDTMTLTGQVLGNYASGKKELALEQLLYGASGGKNGGIALGTETLFAKYGFKNPEEGISYFANVLGEKATQPFASLMGSDDRSKSIVWNPRAGDKGTGAFVYADNGRLASDPDIKASGNYGASMSQTSIVPGMNNFGMPFDPYGTTAGVIGTTPAYKYNGAGSQLQQMLQSKPGAGPSRAQYFGLTDQQQAAGGIELKARQDLQIAADIELANKARDQQQKLAEEGAKRQFDIASKQASNAQEQAAAQAAFDKAMTSAQISSGTADTGAVIAKLDELKTGSSSGGGTVVKDKDGNPIVRQSGQLFSQSLDEKGKVINDPLKEIGNFGFDMLKNAAGNALTKDIKNPYTQMIANFAIQKGLNYVTDTVLGKTGETGLLEKGISYVADNAPSWIERGISWYSGSARGGPITGPGTGTSDSIPAMLSNGEFVINAKAAKENMALLTAINASGLTQGFAGGGPVVAEKGKSSTLADMVAGFLSSIGVTGEGLAAYQAGQANQVVSANGTYNGFSMSKSADGTTIVDKPGYYGLGNSITSFGKNVSSWGGLLGGLIPGKTALGVAAQLIGGLMTAPFDRQQDFHSNMESGLLGGAMSIGNGNYAMMDGTVRDSTGTTIGGTWTDSSGNAIRSGGGSLSFGVGPNYSAQIASNMSSISESNGSITPGSDVGPSAGPNGVAFASGGSVTGPGSGTSDSIPAMLSNGEFVVNALASKKYRPLLDALNLKHYADGTPATSGSVKDLSKALGTSETNSQLAVSNETLASIDGSLRTISGRSTTGSGTAITGTGSGLGFDTGLGAFGGPANLGGSSVMGTATGGGGGGGRSAPSTMDIIGNVAANVAKGYLVKAGITAVTGGMMGSLGAVLPSMYGAYSFAGGGMAGIGAALESGATLTSMALAEGATAIGSALSGAATFLATNPVGWAILGAVALFSIYGGGGGGSRPLPKEPKFHAAMYVSGNNDPNAIAPIYETTDYHAVPDTFKTIAYGLLRVAFNATKAAEAVTKIPPRWDWLYIKVQFDKISLIWGKGAPPKESLLADSYPDNMSWAAPGPQTNLNTVASDIIDKITQEFKTDLAAENANIKKLETAATGLKNYSLDELSSGLIEELKSGNLKLDPNIKKGIYAADVNESNRISSLILAATSKAAYITDSEGNQIASNTIPEGGSNMVYSMKQGKFVNNPYGLDTILLDQNDRPVYNIEGTSAGLTIDDFVSAEKAGTRTANILASPATAGSGSGGSATVVNAPSVVNNDASSLNNYYTTNQSAIDALRTKQPG